MADVAPAQSPAENVNVNGASTEQQAAQIPDGQKPAIVRPLSPFMHSSEHSYLYLRLHSSINKICVRNLNYTVTDEELLEFFAPVAEHMSVFFFSLKNPRSA